MKYKPLALFSIGTIFPNPLFKKLPFKSYIVHFNVLLNCVGTFMVQFAVVGLG